MSEVRIRRPQAGCWANKTRPYWEFTGTLIDGPHVTEKGVRILVEWTPQSGKTRREWCAIETLVEIDGKDVFTTGGQKVKDLT